MANWGEPPQPPTEIKSAGLARIFHGLILAVQILCDLGFLFEFRFEGAIVAKCPLSPKLSQSRFRLPERQPESGASLEESVRSNA